MKRRLRKHSHQHKQLMSCCYIFYERLGKRANNSYASTANNWVQFTYAQHPQIAWNPFSGALNFLSANGKAFIRMSLGLSKSWQCWYPLLASYKKALHWHAIWNQRIMGVLAPIVGPTTGRPSNERNLQFWHALLDTFLFAPTVLALVLPFCAYVG